MKKFMMIVLVIMCAFMLCACGAKKEGDTVLENKLEVSKIDSTKEYVYDAEYTYEDLEGKSYRSQSTEQTYSLNDIVLPYININSQDAINANNEIKKLFNELAEHFKNELEDTQTWYDISNYKSYINGNILSVVITTESGGSSPETYRHYAYNFELDSGEKVSYADVYKTVGFASNNIDSKIEEAIKNDERYSYYSKDDQNLNNDINKSIENYSNSVKDESINYFIDSNGKLNVIVTMEISALEQEIYETIFIIS